MKSTRRFTLEWCREFAIKYRTKSEWGREHKSSYSKACREKWIDLCCSHMDTNRKPNGYWTIERCMESASKHKTKRDWSNAEIGAYDKARRNNWISECCHHMDEIIKPRGYWTLERCKETALLCKTFGEWTARFTSARNKAMYMGWTDECCQHMTRLIRSPWTHEEIIKSARKYSSREEWKKEENGALQAAYSAGITDTACSHMKRRRIWTKKTCMDDALLYKTKSKWQKASPGGYKKAKNNGWLDECCAHMPKIYHLTKPKKEKGYWNIERCLESSLLYEHPIEWSRCEPGAYNYAQKNDLLELLTERMSRLKGATDNNAVYIWLADDEYFNGNQVYKIGLTSARLGTQRPYKVRKDAKIIILSEVVGSAREHERLLLELGDDPKYAHGDGRKEYRALSDSELQEAIDYIESVSVEIMECA